ncbi:MAG: hypothetical protein Q8N57_03315 [bacterium]|nr:hypothetical protein [bacterium]
MIDQKKLNLLRDDVASARENNDPELVKRLIIEAFDKHKDVIGALSAEEALYVEHELGFWQVERSHEFNSKFTKLSGRNP